MDFCFQKFPLSFLSNYLQKLVINTRCGLYYSNDNGDPSLKTKLIGGNTPSLLKTPSWIRHCIKPASKYLANQYDYLQWSDKESSITLIGKVLCTILPRLRSQKKKKNHFVCLPR
jgi:hypothetical protein